MPTKVPCWVKKAVDFTQTLYLVDYENIFFFQNSCEVYLYLSNLLKTILIATFRKNNAPVHC